MSASKMSNHPGGLGSGEEDDEEHKMNEGADNDNEVQGDESASGHQQQGTVPIARIIMTRKKSSTQSSSENPRKPKKAVERNVSVGPGPSSDGSKNDKFCWYCHKDGVTVNCRKCPRSYHSECMSKCKCNPERRRNVDNGDSIVLCPECEVVTRAETIEFRSESMKQLTHDQLLALLKDICSDMKEQKGAEPFLKPMDPNEAKDFCDYIVHPLDIETLEKNVENRKYRSTEGFLADVQWLEHNAAVVNSSESEAKGLLKFCKRELNDIETCADCCLNALENTDEWFVKACRRPHILVWAKVKSFPYWPGKAMQLDNDGVDVWFFGQHDRARILRKDCLLYSEEMPAAPPKKSQAFAIAMKEVAAHIKNLREVHGSVIFAASKELIGPQINTEQIRRMLPEYNPPEGATKIPPSSSATNVKTSSNNNSDKNEVPPPPPAKSLLTTSRSSSLKTNPTNVKNSSVVNAGASSSFVSRKKTLRPAAGSGTTSQKPTDNAAEPVTSNEEQSFSGGGKQDLQHVDMAGEPDFIIEEVQNLVHHNTPNPDIHKWFFDASIIQKKLVDIEKQKDDSEKRLKELESKMKLHLAESKSKLQKELEGKEMVVKENTDLKKKLQDLGCVLKNSTTLNREKESELEQIRITNSKLQDEVKAKDSKIIDLRRKKKDLKRQNEELLNEYSAYMEAKEMEIGVKRKSLLSRFPKCQRLQEDEDTDSDN